MHPPFINKLILREEFLRQAAADLCYFLSTAAEYGVRRHLPVKRDTLLNSKLSYNYSMPSRM